LLTVTTLSHADVIAPPPIDCPPGQVGVTSHGGPSCLAAPPRDCPVGWRGEVGGECVPHHCDEASGCPAGLQCKPESICLTPIERHFENRRGRSVRLERAQTDWEVFDICAPSIACRSPSQCRATKLCLPLGTSHAAPRAPGRSTPAAGGCASCGQRDRVSGLAAGSLAGLALLAPVARRRRG
jgi:hypothetical protein